MDRLEKLCVTCWDRYLEVSAANRVLCDLLGDLLTGRRKPGAIEASSLEGWMADRIAEEETELLLPLESFDPALAAELSARAEARRRQGQTPGDGNRSEE